MMALRLSVTANKFRRVFHCDSFHSQGRLRLGYSSHRQIERKGWQGILYSSPAAPLGGSSRMGRSFARLPYRKWSSTTGARVCDDA